MLSDGTNSFTWNARNQVAKLNNVSLQYDAFGRRTQNAAGTSFLYNGANAVQELSGSTVTANLLNGGIDEAFTRADSSGVFTPLKDALGSAIAQVDANGNMSTSYTYEPFGNTSVTGTGNGNEFQYTGRENEGGGLYFYRARYYSPLLGRFVSEDPLGFAGGDDNLYAYVLDSPINFVDPTGLRHCPNPVLCPDYTNQPQGHRDYRPLKPNSSRGDTWWATFGYSFFHDLSLDGPDGKPLCIAVSWEGFEREFNPFNTDPEDQAEEFAHNVSEAGEYYYTGTAVNYVLRNGLAYPMKSAVVRRLLLTSEAADKLSPLATAGFGYYKIGKVGLETIDVRDNGGCYASFLPQSMQ